MALWVLYTECDSEPTFWGYVRSKKTAREWCIEELKEAGCSPDTLGDYGDVLGAQLQDDSHYVNAVKLERI